MNDFLQWLLGPRPGGPIDPRRMRQTGPIPPSSAPRSVSVLPETDDEVMAAEEVRRQMMAGFPRGRELPPSITVLPDVAVTGRVQPPPLIFDATPPAPPQRIEMPPMVVPRDRKSRIAPTLSTETLQSLARGREAIDVAGADPGRRAAVQDLILRLQERMREEGTTKRSKGLEALIRELLNRAEPVR